jgi:hypothetical protein
MFNEGKQQKRLTVASSGGDTVNFTVNLQFLGIYGKPFQPVPHV